MNLEFLDKHFRRNAETYSGMLLCLILMSASSGQVDIAFQDRDRTRAGLSMLETPQRGSERIYLGITGVLVSVGGLVWGSYIINSNSTQRRKSCGSF